MRDDLSAGEIIEPSVSVLGGIVPIEIGIQNVWPSDFDSAFRRVTEGEVGPHPYATVTMLAETAWAAKQFGKHRSRPRAIVRFCIVRVPTCGVTTHSRTRILQVLESG